MLNTLPPREARILQLRLGLLGEIYTLAEVARKFGISGERVRQIEATALRQLRWRY